MKFEVIIGHSFQDKTILRDALTHPSAGPSRFEMLEFIGDRVLNLCIAQILWSKGVNSEQEYAHKFMPLTHRNALYAAGLLLKLDQHVLWKGEIGHKKTVVQDACEAVLGALFLDAGFEMTLKCVQRLWSRIECGTFDEIDPKSSLQNWANKHKILLKYEVVKEEGPQHKKKYMVKLTVDNVTTFGNGLSIKSAEQNAAYNFLKENNGK